MGHTAVEVHPTSDVIHPLSLPALLTGPILGRLLCAVALLLVLLSCGEGLLAAADAPLPDPETMRQRALARMHQEANDLEKYSCLVDETDEMLNKDGSVKSTHKQHAERFFVNGQQIDHVLAEDGKPLTNKAAKKEQERVDKQVHKYSDAKNIQKAEREDDRQRETFMRFQQYRNGRREWRDSRSVIAYDMQGDPRRQPHSLLERFAQALTGRIWLDEESGSPVEISFRTDHDIKVAGGLLANLHSGFSLHLAMQRLPEGVWLEKSIDVRGDVTAGLFAHPHFHVLTDVAGCHVYGVDSTYTLHQPTAQQH